MTVDNPPSTVNETKGQVFKEKTNEEPTLSIQIKPPTTNENVPEEPSSPNEEKRANSKRRGLFNNPFAKHSPKKETSEDIVHANDATTREATDSEAKPPTSPHGENKIAKGLGNLYTRLKKSASSHNIKEIADTSAHHPLPSPPAAIDQATEAANTETRTAATTAESKEDSAENAAKLVSSSSSSSSSSFSSHSSREGTAAVHETETPHITGDHSSNPKRQSLLSKLFGGNSKKKEDDHVEGDHSRYVAATSETATSKQNDTPATPAVDPESKEAGPSSPTLGRRVTGFFAKRIPSHKRQNKDKAEVSTGQETMADSTTASGHRDAETSATTNGKDQANKESSPTSAVAAANIATEVANVTTTNTATTVA